MFEEEIILKDYGTVGAIDADWPSGVFLLDILSKLQHQEEPLHHHEDPLYWQVSARWALLHKFGYSVGNTSYQKVGENKYQLVFTDEDIESIQSTWKTLLLSSQSQDCKPDNDLVEMLRTSTSNKSTLQWSSFESPPGHQFKMHAHGSIELAYILSGAVHEVKMNGEPLPLPSVSDKQPNNGNELEGLDLSALDRSWYVNTIFEGQWLVNETGSIHKPFTATSGNGVVLLALWRGSHVKVAAGKEPVTVNVDEAAHMMDDKLGQCDCNVWDNISQIFSPRVERMCHKKTD